MRKKMNRQEFLDRCANAWDTGTINQDRLILMRDWLDAVMRFEGGQLVDWVRFLQEEMKRNNTQYGGTSIGAIGDLASDQDGYALQQFAAILTHPCQTCATSSNAWWTRSRFCQHKQCEQCGSKINVFFDREGRFVCTKCNDKNAFIE